MSASAAFASTPASALCQVTTANTARDGTGTIVDLITAPAEGARVDAIEIAAAGTTTAGVVRLFLYDGTNTRLWKEILVQAVTPGVSQAVWSSLVLLPTPLILKNGWKVKASTHNAETFNLAVVTGGTF